MVSATARPAPPRDERRARELTYAPPVAVFFRETYTLNDVHCKTCKPARVQSKRARENSVSTVAGIETDESDLDIPREIRGPYVRSPSLSIPDPADVKRQAEERARLARPPAHTVQQLVQAAAANTAASAQMDSAHSSVVTIDGTPVLTPSISLSTANSQPKSPSPPFGQGNDDYGDNDIFQQYMNSLDAGTDRVATQRESAMAVEDMENLWAIIDQPLGSALGLGGEHRKQATSSRRRRGRDGPGPAESHSSALGRESRSGPGRAHLGQSLRYLHARLSHFVG